MKKLIAILALFSLEVLLVYSSAYSFSAPVLRKVADVEESWSLNHILVTMGNRVREIDTRTGNTTWEYVEPEGEALFSADRLPNKHTLITLYDKVFEVNEYGQIVWERHTDPLVGTITYRAFYDALRLANGDTLVSGGECSGNISCRGRLWQYNPSGEQVWTYSNALALVFGDGDRLPNGNTLLSSDYAMAVMEIDPNNNIVFSYNDNGRITAAFTSDRLGNGNTLISAIYCEHGYPCNAIVREITPTRNTVWEYLGLNGVAEDADRLPDGTILIADKDGNPNYAGTEGPNGRIIIVNSAGQILWQYRTLGAPRDVDAIPDAYTLP